MRGLMTEADPPTSRSYKNENNVVNNQRDNFQNNNVIYNTPNKHFEN